MANINQPDTNKNYGQRAQEIARLESAKKRFIESYSRAHPSARFEPLYMHFPQTSHNSMPQLYARLVQRINQLKGAEAI